MNTPDDTRIQATFEPRFPTLVAAGVSSLWIFILSLPMWTGKFLGTPISDQYKAGFGFRAWAAEQWKTTGEIPLWNPELFGGMPFVAGMHGDIFYPTAWTRLLLPIDVAMNLGFAVHYVLVGLFTYLLLRRLQVSWTGSVVGGIAYQLTGVVASYVNPGHDGKLFVSALFPLALLALIMAIREKRLEGQALLALTVGLAFLAPHPQLLYYLLVAAGLFALYLTFGEPTAEPLQPRLVRLGVSLGAIFVAFGIGAIQMIPFYNYIPFSPRAESVGSWERATSFAIPWEHIPEFFLAHFAGEGTARAHTYWGGNGIKFHSEYLGLGVVALAVLGVTGKERRRLKWWLGGIAALFLLVALGGSTPFYRLWYAVMPFMKQVRAPGMAFYIPSFMLAAFAAFGVDRLLRGEGATHVKVWLGTAGAVVLLALVGAFGGLAEGLASALQERFPGGPFMERAAAAADSIRWGAVGSGVALAALGGLAWAFLKNQVTRTVAVIGVIGIVGTDLWWNARTFWNYSDAPDVLFAGDPITDHLLATEGPFRVWNVQVYPSTNVQGSVLMAYGIPELLGHHGNELHAFDQLMGGQDIWRNLPLSGGDSWHLLDLYGVSHLILPAGRGADSIPGFTRILSDVPSAGGIPANLFEPDIPTRYARIVPAGLKFLNQDQLLETVADLRFPIDRVVALDSTAVGIEPPDLSALPDTVPASVSVTEWRPGHMRLEITPAAPQDAFVVIGENWYFEWQATVDGQAVTPIRGNGAVLTVPVSAGAREIELTFESEAYRTGKGITLASLLLVAIGLAAPVAVRRRQRG